MVKYGWKCQSRVVRWWWYLENSRDNRMVLKLDLKISHGHLCGKAKNTSRKFAKFTGEMNPVCQSLDRVKSTARRAQLHAFTPGRFHWPDGGIRTHHFLQRQVLLLSRFAPIRYSGIYVEGTGHRQSKESISLICPSISLSRQPYFTSIKEPEGAASRLTMSLQSSTDQWHVIVQQASTFHSLP